MIKFSKNIPVIIFTLFVVYSVIAFALPFSMNVVFWLSYIASVLALFAQLHIFNVAFVNSKSIQSKFYGFPMIRIGAIYLGLQLVFGFIFMVLSTIVPVWIPVIVYVVLIAFAIIGTISAETMREEIQQQDVKLKVEVATMRSLQSQVNALVGLCKDEVLLKKVEELAQELRYSDPVSSAESQVLENELTALVGDLQSSIIDENLDDATELLEKLFITLVERNRICKLGK